MTVSEMLDRMDSREITEWRAYFNVRHEERNKSGKPQTNSPESFRGLLSGMKKRKT